jgi:hypothetical protein
MTKADTMNERELTELFRKLGAQDPEGWAHSQITEGIPQLGRFLFLREAWKLVVGPDDSSWISEMRKLPADGPGGGIRPALDRLLATGAESDLTTVVRTMQWQLLFRLCYLLNDPGDLEPEVGDVAWRLFQLDDDENPTVPIDGLHESVLETEPTGREMRPE